MKKIILSLSLLALATASLPNSDLKKTEESKVQAAIAGALVGASSSWLSFQADSLWFLGWYWKWDSEMKPQDKQTRYLYYTAQLAGITTTRLGLWYLERTLPHPPQ